jgi:tetratricopeptide (TPR) repeat protein
MNNCFLGKSDPFLRDRRFRPWDSRGIGSLLLFLCLWMGACLQPKMVQVPVTPENIQKAAQLVREGDQFFVRKEYYPALAKYIEAARLNPNNEYIFNKMGISYSALGFYREAEQAIQRSLSINPKYFYAFNNLGTVYFAQGDLKKAEKFFKMAIKMAPKIASFYVNLGQVYMENNQFSKAMDTIRMALKMDPNVMTRDSSLSIPSPTQKPNPEKNYNLARLFALNGDVDRSIRNLEDAMRHGFTHLDWVDSEKDFDAVRDDPKFALFLSEARLKYRVVP